MWGDVKGRGLKPTVIMFGRHSQRVLDIGDESMFSRRRKRVCSYKLFSLINLLKIPMLTFEKSSSHQKVRGEKVEGQRTDT